MAVRSPARGSVIALLASAALLVEAESAGAAPALGYPQFTIDGYGGAFVTDDATRPATGTDPVAGGRAGLLFLSWFGIEGTYGAVFDADGRSNHVGADAIFQLPGRRIIPYLSGGWAQVELDPDHAETQTLNGWGLGGGVKVPIWRRLHLRLDARDVMVEQDGPSTWLHDIVGTAGLHLTAGGRLRDTDADGVADKHDRCPETPPGAAIDAAGCPLDADADGVADGIDACPDTPRGVRPDAKGCPIDSDRDGVFDGADRCAATPAGATVDASGCPTDADADGVWDGLDRCAATPAGARVDSTGCPLDSDGDGVSDGVDRCPETAAGLRVDPTGCPLLLSGQDVVGTGILRLENITFESGKAVLTRESEPVLGEVAALLAAWPQIRIEIGGHTDGRGSAASNQKLSQARAQAVLDDLLRREPRLDRSMYSVRGYGESTPVAEDSTPAGQARNRRVEFKILDREALERELERRRQ